MLFYSDSNTEQKWDAHIKEAKEIRKNMSTEQFQTKTLAGGLSHPVHFQFKENKDSGYVLKGVRKPTIMSEQEREPDLSPTGTAIAERIISDGMRSVFGLDEFFPATVLGIGKNFNSKVYKGSIQKFSNIETLYEILKTGQIKIDSINKKHFIDVLLVNILHLPFDGHKGNIFLNLDNDAHPKIVFHDNSRCLPNSNDLINFGGMMLLVAYYSDLTSRASTEANGDLCFEAAGIPLSEEDIQYMATTIKQWLSKVNFFKEYLDLKSHLLEKLPKDYFQPDQMVKSMQERLEKLHQILTSDFVKIGHTTPEDVIYELFPLWKFANVLYYALGAGIRIGTQESPNQIGRLITKAGEGYVDVKKIQAICRDYDIVKARELAEVYVKSLPKIGTINSSTDEQKNAAQLATKNAEDLMQEYQKKAMLEFKNVDSPIRSKSSPIKLLRPGE